MFRIECFSPDELKLIGELDLLSYDRLQVALGAFTGPIRLDVSGLEFMDSTGLRVLVDRIRTGPVTLVDPQDRILRLLDICGLRDVAGLTIETSPGSDPRRRSLSIPA